MMNDELRAIFEQDQADRQGELPPEVGQRDRARRAQVEELIAVDALQAPEDYFHTAMVFQHGERLEHFLRAHELALKAAELDHPQPARWLAAATYDRWLMYQGQPQKYGTQYKAEAGRWKLCDTDPTTSDEERAAWHVPSLTAALALGEELTRDNPPPASATRGLPLTAHIEEESSS